MPFLRQMIVLITLASLATRDSTATEPIDFVREVRPIFENHCYDCHSGDDQESGLRLDVKSAAMKGGDNYGPDIVPGKPNQSPLIEFITTDNDDHLMPPGGRMSDEEIRTLVRWVDEGALWPDDADLVTLKDTRDHWSFKPLAVPQDNNSIDSFIIAKHRELGLRMSPPAERRTWIRRVALDLTGLPPTFEQVTAFVNDDRADAYERVVDELLSSARYGERWGQHWLDVVRYADTHGFEVNTERPNAWPYRDYVIRAFNSDTPYNRFIQEQLTGDLLGEDAATGFLVTASVLLPGQIGKDEPSIRLARQDSLDEIVNNISQTFLGLSVGCARCHDHKFDPITAKDYYAMQAFVAGVEYEDREVRTPEATAARQEAEKAQSRIQEIDSQLSQYAPLAKSGTERPMVNAGRNVDRFESVTTDRVRFKILSTNNLEPCIDELEVFDKAGVNVALASHGATVTSSGDTTVADRHELRFVNDGHYGNSRSWMSNETGKGWLEIAFAKPQMIDRIVWGRDRQGVYSDRLAIEYTIEIPGDTDKWIAVADSSDRMTYDSTKAKSDEFSIAGLSNDETQSAKALLDEKKSLERLIGKATQQQNAFAGVFRTPDDIHLLNRGDPEQPLERVAPTILSAFADQSLPADADESKRRQLLAQWLVQSDNPLTARVMVNRIWQGHFGAGIVETPSDFGNNGMPPSHPELLDWLASEFIRSGWSIKQLHRLIVLSDTYRQSSQIIDDFVAIDSDVRYLWRYPSRRLEAETIRDSVLAVSGKLNLKMYGRGFDLFNQRGGLSGFVPVESYHDDGLRRMIYAHKVRRETEAVFGAFDCPDAGQSTAVRIESTTPIQALNLFNSRFTLEQATALAQRAIDSTGDDIPSQINRIFQIALQREPRSDELEDILPVVQQHGLATLCRVLFNSNEFLFVP
jgi:mono/diheme cytochrome c family protein